MRDNSNQDTQERTYPQLRDSTPHQPQSSPFVHFLSLMFSADQP